MTALNPQYTSKVFRWVHDFVDGARSINGSSDGGGATATRSTTAGQAIFGPGNPTSMESRFEIMLAGLYFDIWAVAASFTVTIRTDGRLDISHSGANSLFIEWDDGSTIAPSLYGFDDATITTEIPTATTVTSDYQIANMWNPNMFFQNDTGDMRRFEASETETVSEIPSVVKYGGDFFVRVINWEAIAAARIRASRAADALFSASSGTVQNDPNVPLEAMVEYVVSQAGTEPGQVHVFSEMNGTDEGTYYVNLTKSNILKGVLDSDRYDASSLETFNVLLHLRKV